MLFLNYRFASSNFLVLRNNFDDPRGRSLTHMNSALGHKLGKEKYIFEMIDELGASLDKQLEKIN